ncbi:MAG: hypothetical protein M2R45_04692 [Verrucomicrobia subdivision 3 bacterium]|nr:hypothetical protein [Limisphaerales bacterium]MCS1416285.1 hypothetical protein [Limisphaerales bacterium]
MENRKPIPVPLHLRWREFRYRKIPLITFFTTLATVVGLWVTQIESPSIVGKAIGQKASITAPVAGKLAALKVSKYQTVKKGQTVALIQPITIKTQLDAFRLQMDFIRNRFEPIMERKRNAVSYYRLRLAWLDERVELAASKVNLQRAENELSRDRRLFEENLISSDQFDQSQKTVQALKVEVTEAAKMVSELGEALDDLRELDALLESNLISDQLQADLQVQERSLENIEQLFKPYTLTAPIAGKVGAIHRLPGENVMTGDRILSIIANKPTQLIAYVNPPIWTPLEPGTPVRIQTRGPNRKIATTQIEGVGPEWEALNNGGNNSRSDFALALSLPILMSMPPGLDIRPGELVDVFVTEN